MGDSQTNLAMRPNDNHPSASSISSWFPWLRLRSEITINQFPVKQSSAAGCAEIIACHTSWLRVALLLPRLRHYYNLESNIETNRTAQIATEKCVQSRSLESRVRDECFSQQWLSILSITVESRRRRNDTTSSVFTPCRVTWLSYSSRDS